MSMTLNIILTDAGIAEVINAQNNGTAPVTLTQVGFGSGKYEPTASQTELKEEIKRVGTIAGGVVGGNTMHIQALDSGNDNYAVYEIGVYTGSGTLFAVYSQATPIIRKIPASEIMVVLDIILSGFEPSSVTVGDTNYSLAPATTTNAGIVELATAEETRMGADETRAVTPRGVASKYVNLDGAQTVSGDKTFSGTVNAANLTATNLDVTGTHMFGTNFLGMIARGLGMAGNVGHVGLFFINVSTYTAAGEIVSGSRLTQVYIGVKTNASDTLALYVHTGVSAITPTGSWRLLTPAAPYFDKPIVLAARVA